jgi:hypothetical protein
MGHRISRWAKWRNATAIISLGAMLTLACGGQSTPNHATAPPSQMAPTPSQTCAPAQSDNRAAGVSSSQPVLQLAAGLNQPDDLLADGDQVLVGELGSGQIARLGGDGPVGLPDHLPVRIPIVEGMARIGGTLYVADQANDRIVAIDGSKVSTFLSLQPVPGQDGVDGIGAGGDILIVPDSPRGNVLFVGSDGHVQRRVGGFVRPTGAWQVADGSVLIADENAGTITRLAGDGSSQVVVRGLPLADDVVADADGRIYAISITTNRLVQVADGSTHDVATGLAKPQGLAVDRAGNPLVTESASGRLDAVVVSFKLHPALPAGPKLGVNQPLCVGLVRAPGFTASVVIEEGQGYQVVQQPGAGSQGSVRPTAGCAGQCRVRVSVKSGDKVDVLSLAYRT